MQIVLGSPVQINVPITGSGFDSSENRVTTVTLQTGSRLLASQPIPLADIQSGKKREVTFNVTFGPQDVGLQAITATIDPGNALQESNFSNNTARVQVRVQPQLVISNIHVTQAVPDFKLTNSPVDFDLVLGKSTAIQFDVSAPGSSVNDTTQVTLSASLADGSSAPLQTTTIGQIAGSTSAQNKAPNTKTIVLNPLRTFTAGSGLVLTIQASTATGQPVQQTKTVRVKQTNPESIVYIPVNGDSSCISNGPDCLLPLQEDPGIFQLNSDLFMKQAFPVRDVGGIVSQIGAPVDAQILPSSFCNIAATQAGLGKSINACDFLKVWVGGIRTNALDRNFVGIVPKNYYTFRNIDALGETPVRLNPDGSIRSASAVSLVTEGMWTTTAHEIAHTFLFDHEETQVPKPDLIAGTLSLFANLMATSDSCSTDDVRTCVGFHDLGKQWVSARTYESIFKGLAITPGDPQSLIIAAVVKKDGSLNQLPLFFLPNSISMPSVTSGDVTMSVLDAEGSIIDQTSFDLPDTLLIRGRSGLPNDPIHLDDSFFAVRIPFSSDAATIHIARNGVVLKQINPSSQLLIDVIKAIPEASFKRRANKTRETFLDLAIKIERQIKLCTSRSLHEQDRDESIECSMRAISLILELREARACPSLS